MRASRLNRFLNPRSIAIVGASDKGLYTAGILNDLQRYGYTGSIYPVNPKRDQVGGLPCFPSISALPVAPELVIIVIRRDKVLGILDECIALDVPAALIITAGFGESDATGKALEAELKARIQGSDIAVVGPNCAGFANGVDNGVGAVVATRLPAAPKAGSVGFVSASGALMMAMQGVFTDLRLGMSRLISLGNQVDVTLTETLEFLVHDDATQIVGAFIEGIDDGARFRRAALAARRLGKPLVVVKSGRTAVGMRAAATHTAALAGSDAVFRAVCQEAGVLLVEDIDELARTLHLLAAWQGRLPAGKRLALVTQSGGMGSLTADLATLHGFSLPDISPTLQTQLQAQPHLLAFDPYANPADVRGAGSVGGEAATTLSLFLDAPEFDATVLLLAKSAVEAREIDTAHALADLARTATRPFCVVWVGQRAPVESTARAQSLEILAAAGVPVFTQPGDCLRALAHVTDFAMQQQLDAADFDAKAQSLLLDHDLQPAGRGDTDTRQEAVRWLAYAEAERLLAEAGIALAPAQIVADADEAIAAAAQTLGYPVAVKLLAATHTHKSDAGLVRLNLRDAGAVRDAVQEMTARVPTHEGILVQQMAARGVEALIGVENDAQFGPVLACGVGGVLVELLSEVALRLPPLDHAKALAMINETRLAQLLRGFRGQPPGDMDALADLLVRVARLAETHADRLVALDMNPVMVHQTGLSLVDVRVQWRGALPDYLPQNEPRNLQGESA